jgi:hypothetical protein
VQLELGLNFMQLVANLDRKFTDLMDPIALIGGAANSYQHDSASWQRVGNLKQLAPACGNTTSHNLYDGWHITYTNKWPHSRHTSLFPLNLTHFVAAMHKLHVNLLLYI